MQDIWFNYFGEYNGAYVMFINVPWVGYDCAIGYETIDGVTIIYSCGQRLSVYREGSFYSLTEAYESGVLTHNDLVQMRNTYKAKYSYLFN